MILKVRDGDGKIVARFPAIEEADEEAGFTLMDEDDLDGVSQPGDVVVGTTIQRDLTIAKSMAWQAIKAERDARRIVAPTSAGIFDCDETGRSNILGMLQAIDYLGEGVPEPITWKMHDNSFADFTREGFKVAALEVLAHIRACYATSFEIEAQISAAATVEDVEALTWPE